MFITLLKCRAMISQVKDVWAGLVRLADKMQRVLRISRDDCDIMSTVLARYQKGYHPVIRISCLLLCYNDREPASCVYITVAVVQANPASFLLDPAMSQAVGPRVIPLWGSLQERDQDAVQDRCKHLAGDGNQGAVII